MVKYVQINDPAVQLGFQRILRLLEIKRYHLDQVDKILLQGKFDASQSIKISQLAEIFQNVLALTQDQGIAFARFLIEENDEDEPEIVETSYDLQRQINSQYIPIRIMTLMGKTPAIYTDA